MEKQYQLMFCQSYTYIHQARVFMIEKCKKGFQKQIASMVKVV